MKRTLKLMTLSLAAIVVLWACSEKLGPRETGSLFLNAVAVGDVATAKKYATKESESALNMLNGISKGKKDNPDEIEIGKVEENGNKATLHYQENGAPRTLDLVKVGDEWKANWSKTEQRGGGVPSDSSNMQEIEVPLH